MRARIVAVSALAAIAASVLSIGETGCGSTGNRRFDFDARAGGIVRDASQPYTFVNDGGWTVTLTKANLTVGPIYLNVIAPLRGGETSTRAPFFGLRLNRAFADTDHLGEGRVVGEVLSRVTFDALSPSPVPFPSRGTITEEFVRTADIYFWPGPFVVPDTTAGTVTADLAGEAVRGADAVKFKGTLIIDDAWQTASGKAEKPLSETRTARGIPAPFFPVEGGALEIRVDLRPLFRGADFSTLLGKEAAKDGTKELERKPPDQVLRNVFQGLRASSGTHAVQWVLP